MENSNSKNFQPLKIFNCSLYSHPHENPQVSLNLVQANSSKSSFTTELLLLPLVSAQQKEEIPQTAFTRWSFGSLPTHHLCFPIALEARVNRLPLPQVLQIYLLRILLVLACWEAQHLVQLHLENSSKVCL